MPDESGATPQEAAVRGQVRDLLLRCAQTSDHGERAALLERIAGALECAAAEITAHNPGHGDYAADAAGLHGQADMARIAAELERTSQTWGCGYRPPQAS